MGGRGVRIELVGARWTNLALGMVAGVYYE